jgi:hypothetical protein
MTISHKMSFTIHPYGVTCLPNPTYFHFLSVQTMTHMRLVVNVVVALMLGILFVGEGNEGSRVLDNYNLLFACLIHNMMTPMMITILTCEYATERAPGLT